MPLAVLPTDASVRADEFEAERYSGRHAMHAMDAARHRAVRPTEEGVRDRLRVWRDAGVTTVRLYPAGETLDDRLTTLGRAMDLVRSL